MCQSKYQLALFILIVVIVLASSRSLDDLFEGTSSLAEASKRLRLGLINYQKAEEKTETAEPEVKELGFFDKLKQFFFGIGGSDDETAEAETESRNSKYMRMNRM